MPILHRQHRSTRRGNCIHRRTHGLRCKKTARQQQGQGNLQPIHEPHKIAPAPTGSASSPDGKFEGQTAFFER